MGMIFYECTENGHNKNNIIWKHFYNALIMDILKK